NGAGKRPSSNAAATTKPKTTVSRPLMSLTVLFLGLSSGPKKTFWYMVRRYMAARITAVAESAVIQKGFHRAERWGSGKPEVNQVLAEVKVPASTRNSPTKPHRPGRPPEASTMTRKRAANVGIFAHRPPKSSRRR